MIFKFQKIIKKHIRRLEDLISNELILKQILEVRNHKDERINSMPFERYF